VVSCGHWLGTEYAFILKELSEEARVRLHAMTPLLNKLQRSVQWPAILLHYVRYHLSATNHSPSLCTQSAITDQSQSFARDTCWSYKTYRHIPHTHIHVFIRLRGRVESRNLSQPLNTTLLAEFYLTTTQIIAYTPTQHLPTRTCTLTME